MPTGVSCRIREALNFKTCRILFHSSGRYDGVVVGVKVVHVKRLGMCRPTAHKRQAQLCLEGRIKADDCRNKIFHGRSHENRSLNNRPIINKFNLNVAFMGKT
jgi:hypothetical protein